MIVFLTTVLILLCLAVVLLIMIQRTSGGMGSALGGGAADQVLGAGSAAQLTKMTVWFILGYFILSFALYAYYQRDVSGNDGLQRLGPPELMGDPASSAVDNPPANLNPVSVPETNVNESEQEINSSK